MNSPERRLHPRYLCNLGVEIEWGSEVLRASIRDISCSGMFVLTHNPLWIRAEFAARILQAELLEVNCVVKRIEPGRGMGTEFTNVPEATRKRLEDLLGELAAR